MEMQHYLVNEIGTGYVFIMNVYKLKKKNYSKLSKTIDQYFLQTSRVLRSVLLEDKDFDQMISVNKKNKHKVKEIEFDKNASLESKFIYLYSIYEKTINKLIIASYNLDDSFKENYIRQFIKIDEKRIKEGKKSYRSLNYETFSEQQKDEIRLNCASDILSGNGFVDNLYLLFGIGKKEISDRSLLELNFSRELRNMLVHRSNKFDDIFKRKMTKYVNAYEKSEDYPPLDKQKEHFLGEAEFKMGGGHFIVSLSHYTYFILLLYYQVSLSDEKSWDEKLEYTHDIFLHLLNLDFMTLGHFNSSLMIRYTFEQLIEHNKINEFIRFYADDFYKKENLTYEEGQKLLKNRKKNSEKIKKIDDAELGNFFANLTTLQAISLYEVGVNAIDKNKFKEDEQLGALRAHIMIKASEYIKTFPNTAMELSLILYIYIANGDLDILEKFYNDNKNDEDKIELLKHAFDNSGELLLLLFRKKKFAKLYEKVTGREIIIDVYQPIHNIRIEDEL